jgi:hypothetical protein
MIAIATIVAAFYIEGPKTPDVAAYQSKVCKVTMEKLHRPIEQYRRCAAASMMWVKEPGGQPDCTQFTSPEPAGLCNAGFTPTWETP